MLVIVFDNLVESLESAIVVEAAFLVAPQPAQRRGPVLFGWRPGRPEIVNADLFGSVEARSGLDVKRVARGRWRISPARE